MTRVSQPASRSVSKAVYLPLSIGASVAGGMLAGAVFTRVWNAATDTAPPNPKDLSRPGREVLVGAALQGLVFGLVRAAVDRAGARSYRAMTHQDPPV